ncbi:hypothetical protein LOC67_00210 [Stieleria sp. JC731]|nr:3-oxoacyl-[acyl-carrier-protein] synthase III C-terminal domain-containing protein [Stieleria sp. JC731]MCC9598962.1 hypothetical protein [Stieleria sp. JC731]
MGCRAIERALDDAALGWPDIDYIIDCSTSKYRPIPCNAAHFQQAIGREAQRIPCVDVQSTCLGSIMAINLANALFATGVYRNILIVASETALQGVDWNDEKSAGLFGDGAAALVLQVAKPTASLAFVHETYGEHLGLCVVDGGGHHLPAYRYHEDLASKYRFQMDGRNLFRIAIKLLPPMVRGIQEDFQSIADHDSETMHVIPHQASPKAVELIRRIIGVPHERYHVAVNEIGNMVAASIPAMFDRVRKQQLVDDGCPVMLLGTSAGYSQAAIVFHL